jgi:hypothetical protein
MDALERPTPPPPQKKRERESIRDNPETVISSKPVAQGRVLAVITMAQWPHLTNIVNLNGQNNLLNSFSFG